MKSFESFRKTLLTERAVKAECARLAEEFAKPRKRIIDAQKNVV